MARRVSATYTRWLDDRWNPILVKEVRQALRGRFFRLAFICTLSAATVASMAMIMRMGGGASATEGRGFFVGVYTCLAIATMGLVPFQAFTAMGAEWEENTYDMLSISNLRPRQIVGGKLLAALIQILLYFSAFTPFMAFSFLLRQVDLTVMTLVLAATFGASLLLTTIALALSTFSRVRFARVVLMAGLGGLLMMFVVRAPQDAEMLLRNPSVMSTPTFVGFGSAAAAGGLVALAYAFLIATNMLAHPEENRSTNTRILTTVLLLTGMGFAAWALGFIARSGSTVEREHVSLMAMVLLVGSALPAIFFTSEHDSLGRRTTLRVPRNSGLCSLSIPFLPGGSRGVLLWFLHAAGVTLFLLVGQAYSTVGIYGFLDDGVGAYLALLVYLSIYLLLPTGLLAPFAWNAQLRAAVRVLVPFLVIVFAFAPALLGFFVGDRTLSQARHAMNPFHVIDRLWDKDPREMKEHLALFAILVGAGLLLNVGRVRRGLHEVAAARRQRLDHEAARIGSADAVAGA